MTNLDVAHYNNMISKVMQCFCVCVSVCVHVCIMCEYVYVVRYCNNFSQTHT